MEEGSGGVDHDSSGYGNDQYLADSTASPTWSADVPTLAESNGSSMAFDGVNDYAYTWIMTDTMESPQLTAEAWAKFDNASPGHVTLVGDYQTQWWLGTHFRPCGSEVRVAIRISPSEIAFGTTVGVNLQPDRWYHVAFVFDGSATLNPERLKIYVDGQERLVLLSDTMPSVLLSGPQTLVRLGHDLAYFPDYYTTPLSGLLDETQIYTYARSAIHIAADAAGQTARTQPDPIPMGLDDTVYDGLDAHPF
jgi:hypothetical protein